MKLELLNQKDVGGWVWYTPSHGDWEKGRIKSWNESYIFVVYKCNGEWDRFQSFTGAATKPEELKSIDHAEHCEANLGYTCACLPPTLEVKEEDFI